MRQDTFVKVGVKAKRLRADDDYLAHLLATA